MEYENRNNVEIHPINRPLFVLLLGPSGAGKSTIIRNIELADERFTFVNPVTDRPLRTGETEKICVSGEEFSRLEQEDLFVTVNNVYGNRYGTPRYSIEDAFKNGKVPITDWPLDKVDKLDEYKDILYKLYITPPTLGTLHDRLNIDDRDKENVRFDNSKRELLSLVENHFIHENIDNVIINRNISQTTRNILSLIYSFAA